MKPIGIIKTPYETKFGSPKQGGMVRSDISEVKLDPSIGLDSTRGMRLGMFLWLLWEFHECEGKSKELVRPPKLGGNEKLGVFATRSPFRPNNIAMSLLKLIDIEKIADQVILKVQGADMVSGTPVLDIKPYHPVADIPWEDAPEYWFEKDNVERKEVRVEEGIELDPSFRELMLEVLSFDPRPAYHNDPERVYVNHLSGKSVHWKVLENETVLVIKIEKMKK